MSIQFDTIAGFVEALNGIHINYDIWEENLVNNKKSLQQFEPFDPKPIFAALEKMYNEDKNTIEHLKTMIHFGLSRGFGEKKRWESIYCKIYEEARKVLQPAVDFLSVKIGRQESKDTLTVPRLMQSFPVLTWKIHCDVVRTGNWGYVDKAKNAGYNGDLPKCLRYSGSPGVMGPDVWDTYRNEYCSFSLALGRMWKSGQTSEQIARFSVLNYECLAIKPDDRINMAMVKDVEAQIEEAEKAREAKKKELQDLMNQMILDFNLDTFNVREIAKSLAEISDDDDDDQEEETKNKNKNKKQVDDEKEEPADIIEAEKEEEANGEEEEEEGSL